MPKKSPSKKTVAKPAARKKVKAAEGHALHFIAAGLGIIAVFYALQSDAPRRVVYMFSPSATQTVETSKDLAAANSEEDAMVFGSTIRFMSLMQKSDILQLYLANISSQTGRDIVVVDTLQRIIADTVPANRGKNMAEDPDNEVGKTLVDGITRTFVEKGVDYPNGIRQTVVAVKDLKGKVIGAVVMSESKIFE